MRYYLMHLIEDTKKELLSRFPACSPKEWAIMNKYDHPEDFYDSREAALAQLVIFNIQGKFDNFCDDTCEEMGVNSEIIREAILDYLLTPDEKRKLAG